MDVVGSRKKQSAPVASSSVSRAGVDAWRSVAEAYSLVDWLVRRDLADELDLAPAWFDVLSHVGAAEDGCIELGAIEDALVFSQSGVSQLVSRMESAGVVRRLAHSTDGRRTIVQITDTGREVLLDSTAVHRRSVERHFAALLSAEEARVLTKVLGRVRDQARVSRDVARQTASPATRTRPRPPV